MKERYNRFGRRLASHLLTEDEAAIGIGAILLIAGGVILLIIITANIVPLIIFLVLAIVFALIMKHLIFGRRSLGITKGVAGVTRVAGREFMPMARQAGGSIGRLIGR